MGGPGTVDPGHDLSALLGRCNFPARDSELDCAVSGGADSLALLVLAVAAGCSVVAWHVDHGLRPGSAEEGGVVADAARLVGARFRSVTVDVPPGPNLEARARLARYRALPPGVATGHTCDDQAETVLLNLLRGAGTDGLAGIRAGTRRPLLALRRSETLAVVEAAGFDPVVDASNFDPSFRRNRVRSELVPLCSGIAARDVVPLLARQATLLAADADLLDHLADELDPHDAEALVAAPPALARRAVRKWLRSGDELHPPSAAAVERVLEVARRVIPACDVEGGRHVRRSGRRLLLDPPTPTPEPRSKVGRR